MCIYVRAPSNVSGRVPIREPFRFSFCWSKGVHCHRLASVVLWFRFCAAKPHDRMPSYDPARHDEAELREFIQASVYV